MIFRSNIRDLGIGLSWVHLDHSQKRLSPSQLFVRVRVRVRFSAQLKGESTTSQVDTRTLY